jgi:hypothetical protein
MSNTRLPEVATQLDQVDWKPFPEPFAFGGIRWKLLHTSPGTGDWSAIFDCPKGSSIAPHTHFASGQYLLTKGRMDIRGGVEKGGATVLAPSHGYESNGAVHEHTNFPIDSEFYMTFDGPVVFTNPDGSVMAVVGWEQARAAWSA